MKIKEIGVAKKKKGAVKPGYRKPRTAREQAFWDGNRPDYRAWAVKKGLTLDEVSALAMGLDPSCVDRIRYETGQTPARFDATKTWFEDVETEFKQKPIDLLGVAVFAMDYDLPVDSELSETARYSSEGFLDQDKLIERLERKIRSQQETIEKSRRIITTREIKRGESPKAERKSDRARIDKTTSKLIIALLAEVMRRNQLKVDLELIRLKNNGQSKCVSQAMGTLIQMNWRMDEDTLLGRLKEAIKVMELEST
jgi:hypothetical protein